MNCQNEQKAAKPNIVLDQLRMAAADDLPRQVNLFSGTVAFPLDLAMLENIDHTNQLRVSAYYDSNVLQTVQSWNQDAPTGVLGVGWDLPLEKISVDPKIAAMADDEHYYLQHGNNTIALLREKSEANVLYFQTDNYAPWRIRFFRSPDDPLQSYWEIVKEDGQRYIYGATLKNKTPSYGANNTQEYRSRWGNWAGSSRRKAKLYPVAWYLAQILPPWEKTAITFSYDSTFIPFGQDGASGYTRSVRLREITGCGQSVRFGYAEKETFERMLPYETPFAKQAVFQFSYEEHYLESIETWRGGQCLSLTEFTYEFHTVSGEGDAFHKRYLSEVRRAIRGAACPAYQFSYFSDIGDANAGALKSVLYPNGALVSYVYEKNTAASVKTDVTSASPGVDYEPLVFYGADYAVVAWRHKEKHDLRLSAYSWNGIWATWQANFSTGKNTDELEVLTQRDFFVVRYRDLNANRYILQICRRDASAYGSWTCRTETLAAKQNGLTMTTGENFIGWASTDTQKIVFLTYNATDKDWIESNVTAAGAAIYLTGNHNNCVAACYNDKRHEIDYRLFVSTESGKWRLADGFTVSASIDMEHTYPHLFFSGRDSILMSTFVNSIGETAARYTTLRLIITEMHKIELCGQPTQYEQANSLDFPFNLSIVTDTMVCNTTHPARYDGETFAAAEVRPHHASNACRSICDNDLYILAEQTSNATHYTSYAYDPYSGDWREGAPQNTVPGATVVAPLVSGSYAVLGGQVYFKDSRLQWKKAGTLPAATDLETVCLRGEPGYLLYQKLDDDRTTYLQYLKNGALAGTPQKIHQKIKMGKSAHECVLAGGMLFATFTGDTYERADCVTLHYASHYAENGALCPRVVTAISVNDGYQLQTTRYTYDEKTAAFDPYGQTALFSKVQCRQDGGKGYYEKIFYNNAFNSSKGAYAVYLNGQEQALHYYDADDRCVYIETTEYEAVGQIGGIKLAGISIRPVMKKTRTFGEAYTSLEIGGYIEQTTNYAYNALGQLQNETTCGYAASGQLETQRRETRYAWEFYPDMLERRLLHKEAQVTLYGGQGNELLSRTAQKYGCFANGAWDSLGEWICMDGDASAPFIFDENADQTPTGWRRKLQYCARSACGMETETADIDGIVTSHGYDKNGLNRIWSAVNAAASSDEADYTGFESYEPPHSYTIVSEGGEAAICVGEANTGKYSFKIVGITAPCGLKRTFSPAKTKQNYVFSFYAKTAAACVPSDCGVRLTVNGKETYLPIATDGKWGYVHCVLNAADYDHAIRTVEVFVMNAQPSPLWVDDLCFAALDGGLEATVYDDTLSLAVAHLTSSGAITRTGYDKYGRPAAASRKNRQPAAIQCQYNWREGGQSGFDAANPTMKLRLDITGDGYYEDFASPDEWKSNVLFSGSWQVTDGALCGTGALSFKKMQADESFLAFRLNPFASAAPMLRLDEQTLILRSAADYLLLLHADTAMLFADGRPVERIRRSRAEESVTLQCDGPAAFSFFSYGSDFAAAAEYTDNCGRTIQKQLFDEQNVTVSAQLYDAAGRAEITTKSCRLEESAFAYRPGFVTAVDEATGKMEGEVAACWPEDEHFPYSRIRREASPLGRELERGLPGAAFAIRPDIPYEKRNTAKIRYLVNPQNEVWLDKEFFRDLPAGRYAMIETTDIDRLRSYKFIDGNGQKFASVIFGKDDVSHTFNRLDAAGRIQEVYLPNYFSDPSDGREKARVVNRRDFCGRLIRQHSGDADAPTDYVWDDAGRLRFILDPVGAAKGYVLFRQYDDRGRIVGEGYFNGQLSEELQQKAKIPAYLPDGSEFLKRYIYGDTLHSASRLAAQETLNETMRLPVKETFGYDRWGNITDKSRRIGNLDQTTTGFRYDAAGRLTQIVCDETLPEEFRVMYRYNNRGLLAETAYQSADTKTIAAVYAYTPAGTFAEERLPDGISRTFSYDPAGRLTGIDDPLFAERLSYHRPDQAPGGRMTSYQCAFKTIHDRSAFSREYTAKCAYDAFGRLSGYTCDTGGKSSFHYDNNTNLTLKTQSDTAFHYRYQNGSNRVGNIADGNENFAYTYDAGGNATSSGLSGIDQIAYTRLSRMTETLRYHTAEHGGEVKYAFTAADFHCYRESQDAQTVYIRDLDGRILQEKHPNTGEKTTYYVQGHGGIAAIVKENAHYTVIKDRLGSTRLIVKDGIPLLAYNYLPYGEFLGTIYRRNNTADISRYLFCGHLYESETGLYNLGARLYETRSGRFLSTDAAMQSPSPYAYVNGNPLRHTEETGESFLLTFLITALIGAAVTAIASGIVYLATTKPREYSAGGFFKSFGIGFAAGLICSVVSFGASAIVSPIIEGLKTATKIIGTIVSETLIGCASATIAQISANAMAGVPIDYMLGEAALFGAVAGLIMGTFKGYQIYKTATMEKTTANQAVTNNPTEASNPPVTPTAQPAKPESLGAVALENLASNLLYAVPASATEITESVVKNKTAPPMANPQRTRLVLFADTAGQLSYI